jgi:hypothetical protein
VVLILAASRVSGAAAAKPSFSSAYISEILPVNEHGLRDEDNDRSGWIEIWNGSHYPVNLRGWSLTDTPTNLPKWRFPRIEVPPEKSIVIFASGKNRTNNLARLHTSFRLAAEGGYLALVDPATNVVSEFASWYPALPPDVAYGRVRGNPAICGAFLSPSPGRANASSGKGFAPPVRFSQPGGTFARPVLLELTTAHSNATIHYTLDGRLPTGRSPAYRKPLWITNSVEIRARAHAPGLLPGPPGSESYLLLHTNVLAFTSDLPLLVMHTLGNDDATSDRSSFVQLSLHEPVNGRTSLTNPPALTTRAGFHTRGSSTSGMPQSSFSVEFLDEFNQERDRPLLGLPADSDWVLYAPNAFEPIMIHNPFIHQLSRDMGRYSPRTRFLEVFYVPRPGPVAARHYYGVFVLEEKIKVGKHRVDIDRLGPEDLEWPEVTGGYLLKIDRLGPDESGFWVGGGSVVFVEPKELLLNLPQRAAQKRYLRSFFNAFEKSLQGSDWRDPVRGYRAHIDVDSWIDYHVLEVLSGNVDAFAFSTYFYKPRNGKLTFGPHWDFDRALGSKDHRDNYPRQWTTGRFFEANWWSELFTDVDFWQLWVDRWQELRRTTFSLDHLNGLIDRLTDELREAQPRQVERWGIEPRGGSYDTEIAHMKRWLSNRVDFIDRELAQPPALNLPGGPVPPGSPLTMTAPTNAVIYYTLDGSDPRQPQGAPSTNALSYREPIPLFTNVNLVVRVRNPARRQRGGPPTSTPWSGPVRAEFKVGN